MRGAEAMLDAATIDGRRQQMGGWDYAVRSVYILWGDGGGGGGGGCCCYCCCCCGSGELLVEWLSSWQCGVDEQESEGRRAVDSGQ